MCARPLYIPLETQIIGDYFSLHICLQSVPLANFRHMYSTAHITFTSSIHTFILTILDYPCPYFSVGLDNINSNFKIHLFLKSKFCSCMIEKVPKKKFCYFPCHLNLFLLPWLVLLSRLSTGLWTKGSPVWFPIRACVWVAGQVPSGGWGVWEAATHWYSLPLLLPFPSL